MEETQQEQTPVEKPTEKDNLMEEIFPGGVGNMDIDI